MPSPVSTASISRLRTSSPDRKSASSPPMISLWIASVMSMNRMNRLKTKRGRPRRRASSTMAGPSAVGKLPPGPASAATPCSSNWRTKARCAAASFFGTAAAVVRTSSPPLS